MIRYFGSWSFVAGSLALAYRDLYFGGVIVMNHKSFDNLQLMMIDFSTPAQKTLPFSNNENLNIKRQVYKKDRKKDYVLFFKRHF